MASSDFLEFEKQEDVLHNMYDGIKIGFEPKTVLAVSVLRCRDVSVSYIRDKFDEPDPQVVITCPKLKPPNKFLTAEKCNSPTCEMNETFRFILPEGLNPIEEFPVTVELYDVDILFDDLVGRKTIDVSPIEVGDSVEQTISFGKHGEVDIKVEKYVKSSPDLRLSASLHPEERSYRKKRIPFVMETLKKLLPEPQAPRSLKETPVISVVGSGGGYRAVVGMSGAMKALEDAGLVDVFTYAMGLSGSSWYFSSAFARRSVKSTEQDGFHLHLKHKFQENVIVDSFKPTNVISYRLYSSMLRRFTLPVSLVDFWGFNLSLKLLREQEQSMHLSDLQEYVRSCEVPFPVFAAINVRNKEEEYKYYAYLDKSPFEIYFPKFGVGIDPVHFGSVFRDGILVRECPEHPLHFIQGSCGSAFAILLGSPSEKNPEFLKMQAELKSELDDTTSDTSDEEEVVDGVDEVPASPDNTDQTSKIPKFLENAPILTDRTRGITRTGRIYNPALGLSKLATFNANPHANGPAPGKENPGLPKPMLKTFLAERKKKISSKASVISLADAAIHCNVPLELALRPQRQCDVIIVMDFSHYKSDDEFDYQPLYTAATSAYIQGLKFPTIDYKWIAQLPPKEFLLIEGADDEADILWFTLSNKTFREQKNYKPKFLNPEDGLRINDFSVFDGSFSTFKVDYTELEFDRIRELMYFNVTAHIEDIKEAIARAVLKRRRRENA